MLTLPIKKKWFDMILDDEKLEEYRDMTPYYYKRLNKYLGQKIDLILRNGYSKKSPSMRCSVRIVIGPGQTKWGAIEGKDYYVLRIIRKELIGGTE